MFERIILQSFSPRNVYGTLGYGAVVLFSIHSEPVQPWSLSGFRQFLVAWAFYTLCVLVYHGTVVEVLALEQLGARAVRCCLLFAAGVVRMHSLLAAATPCLPAYPFSSLLLIVYAPHALAFCAAGTVLVLLPLAVVRYCRGWFQLSGTSSVPVLFTRIAAFYMCCAVASWLCTLYCHKLALALVLDVPKASALTVGVSLAVDCVVLLLHGLVLFWCYDTVRWVTVASPLLRIDWLRPTAVQAAIVPSPPSRSGEPDPVSNLAAAMKQMHVAYNRSQRVVNDVSVVSAVRKAADIALAASRCWKALSRLLGQSCKFLISFRAPVCV